MAKREESDDGAFLSVYTKERKEEQVKGREKQREIYNKRSDSGTGWGGKRERGGPLLMSHKSA